MQNPSPRPLLLPRVAALVLLFCISALPGTGNALEVLRNYYALNQEFSYLVDQQENLTAEEVLSGGHDESFRTVDEHALKSDGKPVWLKLSLNFRGDDTTQRYYLTSLMENLYDLRLYRQDDEGKFTQWITGNDYPADSREVDVYRYS